MVYIWRLTTSMYYIDGVSLLPRVILRAHHNSTVYALPPVITHSLKITLVYLQPCPALHSPTIIERTPCGRRQPMMAAPHRLAQRIESAQGRGWSLWYVHVHSDQ